MTIARDLNFKPISRLAKTKCCSDKVFSGAFLGYRESRISMERVKPKKGSLKSRLPADLIASINKSKFATPDQLRGEVCRRLGMLLAILGIKYEGEKTDWQKAFIFLARETLPGVSASRRGAPTLDDSLERMKLLEMALHAANKVFKKRMSIPQIARELAMQSNSAQLPGALKGAGYETIKKALYKANDESDPYVVPDPKQWQFNYLNFPNFSKGDGKFEHGFTLDRLPWLDKPRGR